MEGSAVTLPDGHRDMDFGQQRVTVVYDTESYSYDDIFRIFSGSSRRNVLIGTYSPKTHVVITAREVIR